MSGPPDRTGQRWLAAHLAAVLVIVITAVVLGIIMAISYAHEVELASRNGQMAWAADLIPFAVDGMLVVASIALYWAGQHGITRRFPPLATGAVGMFATVGANFVSDERAPWLGPAVAGSVGVAAVLVGWVASWMIETQRELAKSEPGQTAAERTTEADQAKRTTTATRTKRTTGQERQRRGDQPKPERIPEMSSRTMAKVVRATEVTRITNLVRQLDAVPAERALAADHCGGSRRLARDVLAELAKIPAPAEGGN